MRLRLSLAAVILALSLTGQLAKAQEPAGQSQTKPDSGTSGLSDFGIPKALDELSGKPLLEEQTKPGDIGILFLERIALIINFMLGLVGAIAVLMGIISGYMYLTAFGNEEKSASAKKTIFYAAIGLALAFGVWTILQLFGEFIRSAGKNIPETGPTPTAEHGIKEQL